MSRKRCINLDWLEVYALEDVLKYPCDAEFFRRQGYWVEERNYGTRQYREMFTLQNNHLEPLIEIRRNPYSDTAKDGGFFPPNSCHIKLVNAVLYNGDPIGFLRAFLVQFNYELKKIFRLDIALDFELFDKGDDPAKFIERYMKGKYSKINQANITAHGIDQWNGRIWNSLAWGKPKSMVSTKMYCKSLELEQVHDKPYIKLAWVQAGLIDNPLQMTKRKPDGTIYKPVIWRVEFSIKSSAAKVFVIDKAIGGKGKIEMPYTLDIFDTPLKLETMFASLSMHYFHFKHYEEDQRKDRCKDKILFEFSPSDTYYKIDRLASHTAKTKPSQRLINLLNNYAVLHPIESVKKAVQVLVEYIEKDCYRDMLENGTPMTEVIAYRELISMRMKGITDPDAIAQLKELQKQIESYPSLF